MADETRRIIDEQELSEVTQGTYVLTDSATTGTRKYDISTWDASIGAAVEDAQEAAQQAGADTAAAVAAAQEAVAAALAAFDEEAEQALEDFAEVLDSKADADGINENMTAGAAEALIGSEGADASFIYRASAGRDGVARVESAKGNTVVWNQLVPDADAHKSGTAAESNWRYTSNFPLTANHKYLLKRTGKYPSNSNTVRVVSTTGTVVVYDTAPNTAGSQGVIFTCTESRDTYYVQSWVAEGEAYDYYTPLFDLTLMFGAGNKPATVAEFESLYPESYYPYDAGTLLPVRMKGVETVGFNQWDEEWELGTFNDSGAPIASTTSIRAKNYIPVIAGQHYYFHTSGIDAYVRIAYYNDSHELIGFLYGSSGGIHYGSEFVPPAGTCYMRFAMGNAYGTTYNHDICINLSDPSRNGEYKPYWKSTRAIPASTYFPDGMKSAGTVRDELTASKAVKRVGSVDLGTLNWVPSTTQNAGAYRYRSEQVIPDAANVLDARVANIICTKYGAVSANSTYGETVGISVGSNKYVYLYDSSYNTANSGSALKAALDGVTLYYELATPVETPIDPPLNLTYKAAAGGTERILTDSTDTPPTAPPVLRIAYGYNAESLRDAAQGIVANVENGRASTNYAVGSYLVRNGTLYRVTSAIASGEAITTSNTTATTVMAELIRLTQ